MGVESGLFNKNIESEQWMGKATNEGCFDTIFLGCSLHGNVFLPGTHFLCMVSSKIGTNSKHFEDIVWVKYVASSLADLSANGRIDYSYICGKKHQMTLFRFVELL